MLRPAVARPFPYFHPLSNTPAVCFTQDLTPEQDANILLLGCGDARSILYTLHADATFGDQRRFDITCCDIEPALLARNILLFTLLIDDTEDVNIGQMWNIYHHLYLDEGSLHLLDSQARKLHSASDTLEGWRASEYGKCLHFCDKRTLATVHSEWAGYMDRDLSVAERALRTKHLNDIVQRAKTIRADYGCKDDITEFRSCAPLGSEAIKDLPHVDQHFWDCGVTHEEKDDIVRAQYPNPTFASAITDTLTLHYSTNPLLGFHLATAYAPLTSESPLRPDGENCTKFTMVLRAAKLQFSLWTSSFKRRAGNSLTIRFFNGDALSFSCALQHVGIHKGNISPNLYCDPWTMQPLTLDGCDYTGSTHSAPTKFDVVDTANLVDLVGALNVLIVTAGLLAERASSTLYAEVMIQHEAGVETIIDNLLCGHYPTICLLLGLAPIEAWTNATSIGSMDEGVLTSVLNTARKQERQFRTRLRWKKLASLYPNKRHAMSDFRVQFDEMELSSLLSDLYLKMLRHEDLSSMAENENFQTMQRLSSPYYHRSSFSALLRHLTTVIKVDWKKVIARLLEIVERHASALMIGKNYTAELYLYLHLFGLYTVPLMESDCPISFFDWATKHLSSWKTIPPFICVSFTVPRHKLAPLQEKLPSHLGTHSLCCTLQSSKPAAKDAWKQRFAVLQLAFGELHTIGQTGSDELRVCVREDARKWSGKSSLVVSFLAPTFIALIAPQHTVLALGLQHTPHALFDFHKQFGIELRVFETTMAKKGTYITKFMPNIQDAATTMSGWESFRQREPTPSPAEAVQMSISANLKGIQINSLTCRLQFVAEEAKSDILDKSLSVGVCQTSPTVIEVVVGRKRLRYEACFPAPVCKSRADGSKAEIRIARVAAYVEVIAPVAGPLNMENMLLAMFPISIVPADPVPRLPLNQNSPRIVLDGLPVVDTLQTTKLDWLALHLSRMFSRREIKLVGSSVSGGAHKDSRVVFKENIGSIFIRFSGIQRQQRRQIFAISEANGDNRILIFVSAIRLDLSNHTVVLDAAVIPLTNQLMQEPRMKGFLMGMLNEPICTTIRDAEVLRLWKMCLPAFAERCRTWEHRQDTCEYIAAGKVPVPSGIKHGCSPLCSCGIGQLPTDFVRDPKNQSLDTMLRTYATRVAIAPCFAVPYVEECFDPSGMIAAVSSSTAGGEGWVRMRPVGEVCNVCGVDKATSADSKSGALLKCGRCLKARYCSASCQKADWKEHKKTCTKA